MIPRHRSLVPLSPERQAAIKAILYVEVKREAVAGWKEGEDDIPYARAFFRFLFGKSKVSGKMLNRIAGVFWDPKDRRGSLGQWESAFDVFIRSEGRECPLPLPSELANHIFPEFAFSHADRREKRRERVHQVYTRQYQKQRNDEEQKYQARVGQADVELAFQTPETLRAWYQQWSQQDIRPDDLDTMFWQWSKRFPSLRDVLGWYAYGSEPLWRLVDEVSHSAMEMSADVRALDQWLLPNKLGLRL